MNKMIFQSAGAIKKIKPDDAVKRGRDYAKSISQRRLFCETTFC